MSTAVAKLPTVNSSGGDDVATAGRRIPLDPDALLFPAEAAYLMALSERTLEGLRVRGGGPVFFRLQRAVRYKRGDVVAWINKRRLQSTSDLGTVDAPS